MHVFEDLGYFCVDNLPASLIGNLFELGGMAELPGQPAGECRIAVVCDARNRSFFSGLTDELHRLDARGIEYEAQAKTENGKKPDFLFPSQAAYEDPAFPEEQLRMLASKTSIKDRFRQVADEANRIRDKHLFTLTPGDVTHPKLAQLDELHIHLVMPKVVKESYDDLIQGETMTFSRFIEEIQGLQADRPQSLTLL